MKRKVFFMAATMAAFLTACTNEAGEFTNDEERDVLVSLSFSPYDVSPMTRAAASIAGIATHLDVWIINGDDVTDIHQTSSESDFGSFSVTLDKTKTYTMHAVAHRCADDATLKDGVISFPEDKVTHSMVYTQTFTPTKDMQLTCLMQRIVGCFRFEITDDIPSAVVKFRFTIANVYDRWNVSSGGTHSLDRVSTISYGGTSSIFNVYAIVTDAQTTHTVTIDALDANDAVVKSRQFADVPLRNGWRTQYSGTFFTDAPITTTFTVDDWQDYEVVNF